MSKIFQLITNTIVFQEMYNQSSGIDDQIPILNYVFIKAQPLRIYTNAKYMKLFIGDKGNDIEGSQLEQLFETCDFIENISWKKLLDVSEQEYNTKFHKGNKE